MKNKAHQTITIILFILFLLATYYLVCSTEAYGINVVDSEGNEVAENYHNYMSLEFEKYYQVNDIDKLQLIITDNYYVSLIFTYAIDDYENIEDYENANYKYNMYTDVLIIISENGTLIHSDLDL